MMIMAMQPLQTTQRYKAAEELKLVLEKAFLEAAADVTHEPSIPPMGPQLLDVAFRYVRHGVSLRRSIMSGLEFQTLPTTPIPGKKHSTSDPELGPESLEDIVAPRSSEELCKQQHDLLHVPPQASLKERLAKAGEFDVDLKNCI